MKIGIAVDNTIPLHIPSFARFFGAHSKKFHCHAMQNTPRFQDSEIDYETAVAKLQTSLTTEAKKYDLVLLVTAIPFSNNFFYVGRGGLFIISLADWHLLTTLPMSNGLAYMLCQIITKYHMQIGNSHDEKTGCISDFLWDKTGIDVGMRAAFICDQCRSLSDGNPHLKSDEFQDVISILNVISAASRRGMDILTDPIATANTGSGTEPEFDAFLCHNSEDKPLVRSLNKLLTDAGVKTWFDEQNLQPGEVWQQTLERTIAHIAACLVIVGDSGFGPWQNFEQRAFINEFANRGCKVIPVLVGTAAKTPELPLFLRQFMWADLRSDNGPQFARIVGALRR